MLILCPSDTSLLDIIGLVGNRHDDYIWLWYSDQIFFKLKELQAIFGVERVCI